MQRVLTAEQMREADRRTIDEVGIPGLVLMENAASRVVQALEADYAPLDKQRIVVVAGKGSNGGDGLTIARQLLARKLTADLEVVLAADPDGLSGDAAANWRILARFEVEPHIVTDFAAWEALRVKTLRATLIIDALLGTGLSGSARGLAAELIEDLNRHYSHASIVAVDIPSGLASDGGTIEGAVVHADRTVTFTAPKPAQVLAPGAERVGKLSVGRIGTPDSLIESIPGERMYLSEDRDFGDLFALRDTETHKGTYGHTAVVGGSASTPGAAAMTGTAALRSGAGLCTVFTARTGASAVVAATPELMTVPLEESANGSIAPDAFDVERLADMDVVVVGPGLSADAAALTRRVLAACEQTVVVDADGLRAFEGSLPEKRPATLVLTPHPGEMARISGLTTGDVQADRVGVARRFAREADAILVLKGSRTLIARPDGAVFINPTGGPGMATAGSGDVLTGLIAGLLAQFPEKPADHVVRGAVYLHGLAGILASGRRTEQGMLATDLFDSLRIAVRRLRWKKPQKH